MTIPIKYSCAVCGITEQVIHVKARPSEMDIHDWMQSVGYSVGMNHKLLSPVCNARSMSNLMIPMPSGYKEGAEDQNDYWVGMQPPSRGEFVKPFKVVTSLQSEIQLVYQVEDSNGKHVESFFTEKGANTYCEQLNKGHNKVV